MQPIVIDGEELIIALESNEPDGRFYLDRETGEVHVEVVRGLDQLTLGVVCLGEDDTVLHVAIG